MTINKNKNIILSVLVVLSIVSTNLYSDIHIDPRIHIGLNLFPAVIAANKRLTIDTNEKRLTIYIIYSKNEHLALDSKKHIEKIKHIRKHKLIVRTISFNDLTAINLGNNDALFLLEKNNLNLNDLINYAQTKKVILFSPFKGDVEKGVMSGFKVTNKVLPEINLKTMKSSNIDLKAFFLRIAVKYDE